jgi:hypothetical protein
VTALPERSPAHPDRTTGLRGACGFLAAEEGIEVARVHVPDQLLDPPVVLPVVRLTLSGPLLPSVLTDERADLGFEPLPPLGHDRTVALRALVSSPRVRPLNCASVSKSRLSGEAGLRALVELGWMPLDVTKQGSAQ